MANSILDDLKMQYRQGNAIVRLIMVNVAVFVILKLIGVFFFLGTGNSLPYTLFLADWLYLPSSLSDLAFRPWTILTYMFLHDGLFHVLFNMLYLYWFGRILQDYLPNRKVFPLYLLSGIAGGLLFILSYQIFPGLANSAPMLVGASGGVLGVVLATAAFAPTRSLFLILIGPIQLRYLAAIVVVIDLISIDGNNPGGMIAHLGGAAMGYFFVRQLQRGRDLSLPINQFFDWIARLVGRPQPGPRMAYRNHQRTREAQFQHQQTRNTYQNSRPKAQPKANQPTTSKQERVDAILEKIKASGYDSLSADEKAYLFRVSNED